MFFFFKFFFCFLSRYCLSVSDLLCMQNIPLSRNCRSGWHLHDLHLSFANFLFYFLKICFDKEMLNAKNIFFFKMSSFAYERFQKTPKTNTWIYAIHDTIRVWKTSDIFFFINVRRKNKYYLFAHFTEFWSEIVFDN